MAISTIPNSTSGLPPPPICYICLALCLSQAPEAGQPLHPPATPVSSLQFFELSPFLNMVPRDLLFGIVAVASELAVSANSICSLKNPYYMPPGVLPSPLAPLALYPEQIEAGRPEIQPGINGPSVCPEGDLCLRSWVLQGLNPCRTHVPFPRDLIWTPLQGQAVCQQPLCSHNRLNEHYAVLGLSRSKQGLRRYKSRDSAELQFKFHFTLTCRGNRRWQDPGVFSSGVDLPVYVHELRVQRNSPAGSQKRVHHLFIPTWFTGSVR